VRNVNNLDTINLWTRSRRQRSEESALLTPHNRVSSSHLRSFQRENPKQIVSTVSILGKKSQTRLTLTELVFDGQFWHHRIKEVHLMIDAAHQHCLAVNVGHFHNIDCHFHVVWSLRKEIREGCTFTSEGINGNKKRVIHLPASVW